jgi:putative Ca2+/H+ antiporter (TMEM165/GDT1 family)
MPVKLIRLIAAGLFATLGLMTLLQVDRLFG